MLDTKYLSIIKAPVITEKAGYAAQNGKYVFVDQFDQEYSRDIEPMEGGHGDLYYRMLSSYVEAYKAGKKIPAMIKK